MLFVGMVHADTTSIHSKTVLEEVYTETTNGEDVIKFDANGNILYFGKTVDGVLEYTYEVYSDTLNMFNDGSQSSIEVYEFDFEPGQIELFEQITDIVDTLFTTYQSITIQTIEYVEEYYEDGEIINDREVYKVVFSNNDNTLLVVTYNATDDVLNYVYNIEEDNNNEMEEIRTDVDPTMLPQSNTSTNTSTNTNNSNQGQQQGQSSNQSQGQQQSSRSSATPVIVEVEIDIIEDNEPENVLTSQSPLFNNTPRSTVFGGFGYVKPNTNHNPEKTQIVIQSEIQYVEVPVEVQVIKLVTPPTNNTSITPKTVKYVTKGKVASYQLEDGLILLTNL
jgi:hypothetical protein